MTAASAEVRALSKDAFPSSRSIAPPVPQGWSAARFGELVTTKSGNSKLIKGKLSPSSAGGLVPGYSASGQDIWCERVEWHDDGVVLSAVGARCGKTFLARGSWTAIANTHVLIPRAGVDPKWLWYLTNDEDFWVRGGSAQPFVKMKASKSRRVLLPPVEEQRRIAAVLDAADALRVKRREALAKLDTLMQAAFIDMFGSSNRRDWPTAPISRLASSANGSIRTGPFGSQLLHDEFMSDGPVAVLGIDNVVHNHFTWGERRFISDEKYREVKRYTVVPGDVLVTIMGTCGRVAIVPQDIPLAINTKHLCCVSLNQDLCIPEFLWACIRFHPGVLRQLGATKGAVMPGLNMGAIRRTEVPVPPREAQAEFARRKSLVDEQMVRASSHFEQLDTLFASLQQRAFRGEL